MPARRRRTPTSTRLPSAARGSTRFLVVGNDGGVYQRPLNGHVNANGNATDWTDLNDGTMDALQYYAVGIGKIKGLHTTADGDQVDETTPTDTPTVSGLPAEAASNGVLVSGGLQDNGGSLLRPGADTMVSNFGGDGGDVLVDPNDGCNIVQEYVDLSMSVTQTCAHPNLLNPKHVGAFLDATKATSFNIAPPDVNARFIAPFVANDQNINEWLAAGNSLWVQEKGFAIRKPSEWTKAYTLATPNLLYTALAMQREPGDRRLVRSCQLQQQRLRPRRDDRDEDRWKVVVRRIGAERPSEPVHRRCCDRA